MIMCGPRPGVFVIPIIRISFIALTTIVIDPEIARGLVAYQPPFIGREGLLAAGMVLAMVRLLPPWGEAAA
jgi:hypothetical protein